MKKLFTFFVFVSALFLSDFLIAQPWSENFDSQTSGTYSTGTITITGRDWTVKDAGNFSYANTNMGSYAFTINDDIPGAYVTTPAINTCGTVSFKYAYINGNSSNVFKLQKSYDNSSWSDLDTHTLGASSNLTYIDYSFDVNDDATSIYIRILSDNQDAHLFIENYSITAYVASSNDTNSDVDGPALTSQPDPTFISSLVDTDGEEIEVFKFNVVDKGTTDGLATKITQIKIKAGANNDVDWTTHIQGVKLSTDGGTTYITIGTPVITASDITIPITAGDLDIVDNTSQVVSLFIYLKSSGLSDNGILEFLVDDPSHGFSADASGSDFAAAFPGAISNQILIDVISTELRYSNQPTNTEVNATMSTVTVEATDANGNRDLDFSSDLSLSSTGTLTGDPVVVTASNGLATFNSLVHTVVGTSLTFNIERDGTGDWDITSDSFNVTAAAAPTYLIISKVVDPSNDYQARFVELANIGSTDIELSDYTLTKQSNGSTTNDIALNSFTMKPGYVYVIAYSTASFNAAYGCDPHQASGYINGNGNDGYFLKDSNGDIVDAYGVLGQDGTGEAWEYEDSKAIRESSVTQANSTWTAAEWTISSCNTSDFNPGMCNLIPIELLSFDAKRVYNNTLISWATLSELSSDYFSVEWSRDGVNYKELAKVDGAGTSREKVEYNFTHNNPRNGVNYYRLKQYDFDGRSETFNVVSVTFDSKSKDMFIVPNRVDNNLRVEFTQTVDNGRLHIYNMEGKKVNSFILAKGIDIFNFDISGLKSGQYILKYVDVDKAITKKFIKL